ncbi:uncharacterized protein [Dermacentor andersoni]|uniref:uncharacterized protein n=1 Tax=Dermacentor andersoni TaxID=34620 RepID=UPI003B3BAE8D
MPCGDGRHQRANRDSIKAVLRDLHFLGKQRRVRCSCISRFTPLRAIGLLVGVEPERSRGMPPHEGRRKRSRTSFGPEVISLTCILLAVPDVSATVPAYAKRMSFEDLNATSRAGAQPPTPCGELCELPTAPVFKPSSLVRVVVLAVIGALSLAGNAATLASIWTHRRRRSSLYMLLAHLSVADLLVTFFCVLAEAAWTWTVQWVAGDALCKLVKFLQMFALYLSTFILVVIAFDRFAAMRFPMRRPSARRTATRMVAAAWTSAALLSLPQVFIFRVQRGPFAEEFYQCVTYGFYSAQWQEQLYTSLSLVCMFLLPLATLVTTYICTFYTISVQRSAFVPARKSSKERGSRKYGRRRAGEQSSCSEARPPSSMEEARRRLLHRAKMKSLMITVVIVAAFIICWTPYYSMMIIFIFLEPDDQLTEELQAGIFFFGSSTAMINPLIYGVFHLRHQRPSRGSRQFNSSAASRAVDHSTMLLAGSLNKAPAAPAASTTEPPLQCGEDSMKSRSVRGCSVSEATTALVVGNGCPTRMASHSSLVTQHRKEKRREGESDNESHTECRTSQDDS